MASQVFTGKTGNGSASIGGPLNVTDITMHITSITNPKVRQGLTINSNTKVSFAGSYGLMFYDGTHYDVNRWWTINWTKQDYFPAEVTYANYLFWALRPGVTADLTVWY